MLSTSDPALVELLESGGSSLVAGLVAPDGEPFATRAWGIRALSTDPLRLRVNLAAGELARIHRLAGHPEPFRMALTAADVATLTSVQVKGVARDLEAPTADDVARFVAFADTFFATIHVVDGYRPEDLGQMRPADLVVCTLDVEELYDQTPGPQAGTSIGGPR